MALRVSARGAASAPVFPRLFPTLFPPVFASWFP